MAKTTLYFDKIGGFSVAAAVSDGKLTLCRFQTDDGAPCVGNIYKGTVVNVLEGMQAAFIDCGLERNCYMSADDVCPYGGQKGLGDIKCGDKLMVQIVKTPTGEKGAKVTARLSLIGKTIIYLPDTEFVGISHRIEDKELRENLIFAAKRVKRRGEGIVVRNAAPFFKYGSIEAELDYLRKIYERIKSDFETVRDGCLLHNESSMPVRALREYNHSDLEKIIAGNGELFKEICALMKIIPRGGDVECQLYSGRRDMLYENGVTAQILEACSPRVELEGGAYLVIERTEALTAIDVNTGGFVGEDSLEHTVYHTNLAAAREIARQVKLRNIGGIVVVDFIDMQLEEHKKALVQELEKALSHDSAPFRVLPMSAFGLVEFTRKRSGAELSSVALRQCARCGSEADYSDEILALIARAKLLRALDGGARRVCIEVSPENAARLEDKSYFFEGVKNIFPDAQIFILPCSELKKCDVLCRALKKASAQIPYAVRIF